MGLGPSLQAFEEVFPTLPYDSFTPTGKLIYNPKQKMGFDATYYTIQEPLWRKFLSHRNRVRQAVESLHNDSLSGLHDRWPNENDVVLLSLKLQFSYMDDDQDGLVDVCKLITFFNEIGITANTSDLDMNFAINPDDGNEKANLDEYLDIIEILQISPQKIHSVVEQRNADGKYDLHKIIHLPIDIKAQHGLL
ncbi:uncharacterized protein [Dysidea avara]|uniref:uncharacterized protein isoform X2 n=1 Tax=Dysidea avara TaxID=196820 RepID=UPI00332EE080